MHHKGLLVTALVLLLSIGFFAPAAMANPDEYKHEKQYGAAPVHLVSSFEDLLHRQERLLKSFEALVDTYKVPPTELLKSFEDLLRRQAKLLDSFEDVARPYACGYKVEFKIISSFEELLRGQARLLAKFEGLLHKLPKVQIFFIESFEDLLRRQADLLVTFEDMLHCLDEKHHVSPKQMLPYLKSFEDLIRSQAELLMSFEALVKGTTGAHYEKPRHDPYEEKDHYEEDKHEDKYEDKYEYEKPHYDEPKKDYYEEKDKYDRYDSYGDHKDDKYAYHDPAYGKKLPDLHKLVELAKHGMEAYKYHRVKEVLHAKMELSHNYIGMIHAYQEKIKELKYYGKDKEAYSMMDKLEQFRYELSKVQSKLIDQSLEVIVAPERDKEYKHADYEDDYGHYDKHHYTTVKLIITNKSPFTINMASFAVFEGYDVVFRKSLGTFEPGEHKVLEIKVSDPYRAKMILENSVTTGFIQLVSKMFQAAMYKY